jgi:hypothetical protein
MTWSSLIGSEIFKNICQVSLLKGPFCLPSKVSCLSLGTSQGRAAYYSKRNRRLGGDSLFIKSVISAVAVAGSVASLVVFFTSVAPEAKAESQAQGAVQLPHAKGDRLPTLSRVGACSLRAWPYYERNCQVDLKDRPHDTRTVRVIAFR